MIDLSFLDPSKGICFLSYGAGQQSASLLALLTDPDRRAVFDEYVGDRNLVIFHADTQDESAETVAFRAWTAAYCDTRRILYHTIDAALGYHRGGWVDGLLGQWAKNATVGSVAFPSTCSDSLKISPLYAALADVLHHLYGVKRGRKAEFYEYVERFGEKLRVLIGFGRGEEDRAGLPTPAAAGQLDLIALLGDVEMPTDSSGRVWMDRCIQKRFPLIEGIGFEALTEQLGHAGLRGFDRSDCINYLKLRGFPKVWPSMCARCHWASHAQVEALRRFQPEKLAEWKRIEARKIDAWRDRCAKTGARNSYVKGSIPLDEFEGQARAQFGHFSDDALLEHNFSHGHEVRSRH